MKNASHLLFFLSLFYCCACVHFSVAHSPLFCFSRKTCNFFCFNPSKFCRIYVNPQRHYIWEQKKPNFRRSNKQVGWLLEGQCKGVLWHKTIFRYVDFKSFHLGWMIFFTPFIPTLPLFFSSSPAACVIVCLFPMECISLYVASKSFYLTNRTVYTFAQITFNILWPLIWFAYSILLATVFHWSFVPNRNFWCPNQRYIERIKRANKRARMSWPTHELEWASQRMS